MTDNWIKITYFHTLYKENVSTNTREITFKDGYAFFSGKMIEVERIVKIEPIND